MRRLNSVSVRAVWAACLSVSLLAPCGVRAAQQPPAAVQGQDSPDPPSPPQQVTQAPPATRPPLPNRANEVLPSWLRLRAEFRERVEGFTNAGFVEDRDDMYFLSRLRISATATRGPVALSVQVQDARVGGKRVGPTGAPFKAAFDLRQAYAEFGGPTAPLGVRVGRQELAFGDQRLVGHVNWVNSGRTFDAARVTLRSRPMQLELFAASLVRILDGEFDKSGNGNRFAGAYASSGRIVPQATAEPYVFYRRDLNQRTESGPVGSLDQVTTGTRLVGKLPARFDYNVEMAVQRGSLGPDSLRAWAGHWQIRSTVPRAATPRISAEYNFASGDEHPSDGIRGTFDQLYPTAHDKYGLSDLVGWRNIHHVRAGIELTPIRATPVTVNYHSYWLVERRDALYAANGAAIARVPSGAVNTHVGRALDVQVSRPLFPQLALNAGYSHVFAGPFLREATPGASYSGPFVMVTYVFLAEK